jgi:arylsulfatase A-like enzyme
MNKSIISIAVSLVTGNVLLSQTKPNVLYIITDQQSNNMMSCTGNKFLKTPNLDRLAQSGYRFDKTYCANPV